MIYFNCSDLSPLFSVCPTLTDPIPLYICVLMLGSLERLGAFEGSSLERVDIERHLFGFNQVYLCDSYTLPCIVK